MSDTLNRWKLPDLLKWVHQDVQAQLKAARESIGHETEKGDATEQVWVDLFNQYLPTRYHAIKGFVVDHHGNFSDQIDVIIHDRYFTPRIFAFKRLQVVPVESVYAVFESKQVMNRENILYARTKLASVNKLQPTNAAIRAHGLEMRKKENPPVIFGGILSLESAWTPSFGDAFLSALQDDEELETLRIGCVAQRGLFEKSNGVVRTIDDGQHATRFLMRLTALLQAEGTVAAIEMDKYERHLSEGDDAQDLLGKGAEDDG